MICRRKFCKSMSLSSFFRSFFSEDSSTISCSFFSGSSSTVSCSFFSATSRGNYNGAESACGNAINACAALELDANSDGSMETDWYLPSQGELLQAYLDGMYLATSSSWATTDAFWSSTENQFSNTYAWISTFNQGYSNYAGKSTNNYVRCVRSD